MHESVFDVSVNDSDGASVIAETAAESRTRYVIAQVSSYFKTSGGAERVAKYLDSEDVVGAIHSFVVGTTPRVMFFFDRGGGRLNFTHKVSELPSQLGQERSAAGGGGGGARALAFVKAGSAAYAQPSLGRVEAAIEPLMVLPVGDPLHQLERTLRCVYIPLLARAKAQGTWPEIVGREAMSTLQALLSSTQVVIGQCEGNTRLPAPSEDLVPAGSGGDGTAGSGSLSARTPRSYLPSDASVLSSQDRIHALESCVVTWVRCRRQRALPRSTAGVMTQCSRSTHCCRDGWCWRLQSFCVGQRPTT